MSRSGRLSGGVDARVGALIIATTLLAGCAGTASEPVAGPPTVPAAPSERAVPVGRWTELPPGPLSGRHSAVGAWVEDRFVIVGGAETPLCPPTAGCLAPEKPPERDGATFDPRRWRWEPIADAPVPIDFADVAVVDSTMYLLVPGPDGLAERLLAYEVRADAWTELPVPRGDHPDIVAAGDTLVSIAQSRPDHHVLDTDRRTWRQLPADPVGPASFRDPVWVGDRLILAVGAEDPSQGRDPPAYVELMALDARLRTWTRLPDTETIGRVPLLVGRRLVWPDPFSSDGGEVDGWGRSYAQGGILDLDDGSWRKLPKTPAEPGPLRGNLVVGDRVNVYGHLLDPATRKWTDVAFPPGGRRDGDVQLAGSELVLLWGGTEDYRDNLETGFVYRP